MGWGKDFLINGGFGVIGGWAGYHERYHKFQVGPIHNPVSLPMHGLGFLSIGYSLLPPLGGPLLPPHGELLLGHLGSSLPAGLLPPLPKGSPPSILIGTMHPLIRSLLASPIRDGCPLRSWYIFQYE